MDDYFIKNLAVFSPEEQCALKEKRVLVAGCGGLGSSVTELLARSGIGHLILVDADRFEPSNMNRQILCTTLTLGKSKAFTARERVLSINPDADVQAYECFLDENNARNLIRGCDIVIDALDSVPSRLCLEDACAHENIPLVHGAVNGWAFQSGVCPAGADILHLLYSGKKTVHHSGGGIAMTVFACASFEVSEAIKLLLNKPDVLFGKLVFFDLFTKESQIVSFQEE